MKHEIKPYKGGRIERHEFRVTPEVKAFLVSLNIKGTPESAADWLERKAREEIQNRAK